MKRTEKYRIQIHIFSREILVCKYRENSDWFDYIGERKEQECELKKYIQDLIQHGLVEKEWEYGNRSRRICEDL